MAPAWQPHRSWLEVYAILFAWLLACLGVAFLLDWLKGLFGV